MAHDRARCLPARKTLMDPLPLIAAGVGLVAGALLAWVIRGRQLSRQQQSHASQRREFEEDSSNRQVRIETLEVDRERVQGELEQSRAAMGESEAARSREQVAARELLAQAEANVSRLSTELGQLREQLAQAHHDIDLQKQAGRDLEDQLVTAGQQLQVLGEQLEGRQRQLAATRSERDQLVDQLEAGDESSPDRRRRWRISTFFDG